MELAKDLEGELWLRVLGTSKNYQISNFGRVKNSKTGNLICSNISKGGYHRVKLHKDNGKSYSIHRLVYLTFRGHKHNDWNKIEVHHKDRNKDNNKLENLFGEPKYSHRLRHKIERFGRFPITFVLESLENHKRKIQKSYKVFSDLANKYEFNEEDLRSIDEETKKIDRQLKKMIKAIPLNYEYDI